MKGSPEERFWPKVDKTDSCWLWTAGVNRGGYGVLSIGGRNDRKVLAHRFSWELANGPIPPGLEVDHRHTCPKNCVRPGHLRLTTGKQNSENRNGAYRVSKSGIRGVFFSGQDRKWRAKVTHHGRQFYGGLFNTAAEANEAAIALRRKLFTHSDMDVAKRNTTPRKGEMRNV